MRQPKKEERAAAGAATAGGKGATRPARGTAPARPHRLERTAAPDGRSARRLTGDDGQMTMIEPDGDGEPDGQRAGRTERGCRARLGLGGETESDGTRKDAAMGHPRRGHGREKAAQQVSLGDAQPLRQVTAIFSCARPQCGRARAGIVVYLLGFSENFSSDGTESRTVSTDTVFFR